MRDGTARLEPVIGNDPPAAALAPPGRALIARLAGEAVAQLPERGLTPIGPLAIVIQETPDRRALWLFEISDPFALLGRFDAADSRRQARLTIYRRPLLDYWAECGAPLDALIARLVHAELGRRRGFWG